MRAMGSETGLLAMPWRGEQVVMAELGFWDSERGWVSKERLHLGARTTQNDVVGVMRP